MEYLYETPKPSKALVIILITALFSICIIGTFFFQISLDAESNRSYEMDSFKLVTQQVKLLKRQVRKATQHTNELQEREIRLKNRYDSEIAQLKKQIQLIRLRTKSQKTTPD